MAITTPETLFTRDVMGRYVCNTFTEAMQSGPFDVIIIGGGTFGLTLAESLYFRSKRFDTGAGGEPDDGFKPPNYRVLVLEAGPFALPEHVQDVPSLGLGNPGTQPAAGSPLPATRQELIAQGKDRQAVLENWGLPWNSNERFGGLAYCLGGRSLYFGGWSPRYLDTEMHTTIVGTIDSRTLWPSTVVEDLQRRFFDEAADQTGASHPNDFINGALHNFYRQRLAGIYAQIPHHIPLNELPGVGNDQFDAPLAVQAQTRPGFFPFNKFSSAPLGIAAARDAFAESPASDAFKRLMIVPNCHVTSLSTRTYTLATGVTVQEVDGINTSDGFVDLTAPINGNPNRRPVVVLAMGAIESARMASHSLAGLPNFAEIGRNLMVHVRKNVTFTAPLPAVAGLTDLEISALLVRCRTNINGTPVHFHFQITASALPQGAGSGQSDVLLFRKVPDLDNLARIEQTRPGEVDVSIRAVGEMLPNLQQNSVSVPLNPPDNDEYGVPRAFVSVVRGPEDQPLEQAMNDAIQVLAQQLFGSPNPVPIPPADGLGTTFHESGTLRMGNDPARSVVNADGQFHYVNNLYAGDASALPTCGSANPVMNGVALRRRLAKRLVPEGDGVGRNSAVTGRTVRPFAQPPMPPVPPGPGTVFDLFDGQTLAGWRMAGRGTFHAIDGALQSVPSFDLGLLWSTQPMPENFRLELEFFTRLPAANSGVFIRFRNPEALGDYNPAWAAVSTGFEVQIDNLGAPDGLPQHRTGAVYSVDYTVTPGDFVNPQNAQVGQWNQYRIEVQNNVITVRLNGVDTARYTNADPNRGRFSPVEPTFIGLQAYSNYSFTTAFRRIRATAL